MKSTFKSNARQILTAAVVITAVTALTVSVSALNTFAEKAGNWILDGIAWIILLGGIFQAGRCVLKRDWMGAGVTIAVTAIMFAIALNARVVLQFLGNFFVELLGLKGG